MVAVNSTVFVADSWIVVFDGITVDVETSMVDVFLEGRNQPFQDCGFAI